MLKFNRRCRILLIFFLFVAASLGCCTVAEGEGLSAHSGDACVFTAMFNGSPYSLPSFFWHHNNCLSFKYFFNAALLLSFISPVDKSNQSGSTSALDVLTFIVAFLTFIVAFFGIYIAAYQLRMQRYQFRRSSHQHSLYEALSRLDEGDNARKNIAFLISDLSLPYYFRGAKPTLFNLIPEMLSSRRYSDITSDSIMWHKEVVQVAATVIGSYDNWQGANFTNIHFETVTLDDANLSGAYFNHAYLISASLKRADLSNIILYKAELFELSAQWANFRSACLQEAGLQQANLQGADFSGANLNDAYLINSNLTQAKLNYAYLNGARLRHARLRYIEASGADFSEARAEKANFRNSDLSNASFHQANLRHSDFTKATMRSVNLSGADLTGADFSYADLSGANLENAIVDGAVFFNSKIDNNTKFSENMEQFLNSSEYKKNISRKDSKAIGFITMTMYRSNGLEKPYIFTEYEQTDEAKKPQEPQVIAIDSWKHLFEDN